MEVLEGVVVCGASRHETSIFVNLCHYLNCTFFSEIYLFIPGFNCYFFYSGVWRS